MLRYGRNKFIKNNKNNQEENSYSEDENAITPVRGFYKKLQKLKTKSQNDSIPVFKNDNDNYEDLQNIIRRNSNRNIDPLNTTTNNNYKREAIQFDENYLSKNLLLQEFLLNCKTTSQNHNIKNNNENNDIDDNNDDCNDNDDDNNDKLSNTILSSECIYQKFCKECGNNLPFGSELYLCVLCENETQICLKCGVIFYNEIYNNDNITELCKNCQTIINGNYLEKEISNKKLKKNNKNQKRFFHGFIDTLKRVKNIKKSNDKQNNNNSNSNNYNKSIERLQIVHNIDGFDNVFHTKDTFDINEISELKANSSQIAKYLENPINSIKKNSLNLNIDDDDDNLLNIKQIKSTSDSKLNKIKNENYLAVRKKYDYNNRKLNEKDNSIQSISDDNLSINLQKNNTIVHSTPKLKLIENNSNTNTNNSNNTQNQICNEKANSTNNIYTRYSHALRNHPMKYDEIDHFKSDISMEFSYSIKSIDSNDYCLVFDSVIDWLNTIRNEKHIYYNYECDDSIFFIKNIPSRTNYDYFDYNYLNATNSTVTTTTATTITTASSNKSYKSCYNIQFDLNNLNYYSNIFIDDSNYPIYTDMKKNLTKNQNLTTSSGNSIFYTTANNTINENFIQLQSTNINDVDDDISVDENLKQQVNNINSNTPQCSLSSGLSQAHLYSLPPATVSHCLPYEFSNNNNTTKDTESVHLDSSIEQQVISITGAAGGINVNNNKSTVNKYSCQEIEKQKHHHQRQQQQQRQQFQEENNILQQQQHKQQKNLNEFKISQLLHVKKKEGKINNKNIKKNLKNNNSFKFYDSVSDCSISSGNSNSSSGSSCINDEYTQHMVDNFKRNLMEKQKYNELIKQQQRSKRRAIYLKPNDETVDQLQLSYHRDNINNLTGNNIQLPQYQLNENSNSNYNSDLENNNKNNEIEINTNELKNALLNTVISNRYGICEISNTNNNLNNSISNELIVNDLMNTFESVLGYHRNFKIKESKLYNSKNSDTNNNYNDNKNKIVEINNLQLNILNCKNNNNNNYELNSNCTNLNSINENNIIKLNDDIINNIQISAIISKLFPNQIIQIENIILELNLSKCLNKIIIFYDKDLSIFLSYIQNTEKYSRCKEKYLLKFFRKFHYFVITNQIFEKENFKKISYKNNQIKESFKKESDNNNLYCNNNTGDLIKFDNNNNNKKKKSIFNVNIDLNKNHNNIEIDNKILLKKPVPPPRRFLPHMAPTLPPTPPLKPRNLLKSPITLEQSSTVLSSSSSPPLSPLLPPLPPTNSTNIRPKVAIRKIYNTNNINSSSFNMRSQLKDDDEIYQPIWKCQTINNNNNTTTTTTPENKSEPDLKLLDNNNKASFINNESDINNKDNILTSSSSSLSSTTSISTSSSLKTSPIAITRLKRVGLKPKKYIENNDDIKDDSSAAEDTSEEKLDINTIEEDQSQWETDDEFMFSTTKINMKSNSIINKENEDDCYNSNNKSNRNSGGSTSTGSTLTGNNNNNCIRISKSDPELKKDILLINKINNNDDDQNKIIKNKINENLWKTVCIIYSPTNSKCRKILYDYNSNEINYNFNNNHYYNNNNNTDKFELIANNLNSNKNNLSSISSSSSSSSLSTSTTGHHFELERRKKPNSGVILRPDSFRLRTNEENAYKRKITAMALIDNNNDDSNNNCYDSNNSSESIKNEFLHKSDFKYNENFNNNYQSIILAWKKTLMDINYIEDEEDMYVADDQIVTIKESVAPPEPNRLQRYKSQSTDNLNSIPDAQDKKSIGERFRNKLQRGVLKLNSLQTKDNSSKKTKEIFKRSHVNSVCLEEEIQPKHPIFDAELQNVEMSFLDGNVPRFVIDCIDIIEQKDCVQIDGLYRASGNKVAIDDLKKKLTENYIYDYRQLLKNEDIHTVTGLLKLFFRELKTPLVPEEIYRKLPDNLVDNSSLPIIKEILNSVKQPSLGTLKYLLKHLTTVALYCTENRMPASNLAIIWGPCILLSENTGPFDIGRMNTLAKILIEKYDFIFGDDERLLT